jgi:hypothetical protein
MAPVLPDRDGRGRGSACARGVDARISRAVGISAIARTPSAYAWSGAGRRPNGRPGGGRMKRSKPSTPRPSGRAVSVPQRRRNHQGLRKLRQRVVTQQKFFRRLSCAIGRDVMMRRRSRDATRHVTAATPAVRRFAGCWIANASGRCVALSEPAFNARKSIRPLAPAVAPNNTALRA